MTKLAEAIANTVEAENQVTFRIRYKYCRYRFVVQVY